MNTANGMKAKRVELELVARVQCPSSDIAMELVTKSHPSHRSDIERGNKKMSSGVDFEFSG